MKNIKSIISTLNANGITAYEYKEGKKICGYELNTYTEAGVNQIVLVDFRDTDKNPKSAKDFLELYNERVNDIDITDEVDTNRLSNDYRKSFTLSQSLEDFTAWKEKLQGIFAEQTKGKTAQQRQFEQVTDKFKSLLSQMEETMELMPLKGNTSADCQRTAIEIELRNLYRCINGISLEDFTPNEYSGDFKLSYS